MFKVNFTINNDKPKIIKVHMNNNELLYHWTNPYILGNKVAGIIRDNLKLSSRDSIKINEILIDISNNSNVNDLYEMILIPTEKEIDTCKKDIERKSKKIQKIFNQ